MRYFLDCEFNGFGGELITLAMVAAKGPQDGRELYLRYPDPKAALDPWVAEHVLPVITDEFAGIGPFPVSQEEGALRIGQYLQRAVDEDGEVEIIADWPDDIAYVCRALIVGPGQMAATPHRIGFGIVRVDAYPTQLPHAVQHNALWDARALRHICEGLGV